MTTLTKTQLEESLPAERQELFLQALQIFWRRDVMPSISTRCSKTWSHFIKLPDPAGPTEFFRIRVLYHWDDKKRRLISTDFIEIIKFHDRAEFDLANHVVRIQNGDALVCN